MVFNNSVDATQTGMQFISSTGQWSAPTATQNAIILGGAANAITSASLLTNGQLLIGSTGVAPVAAAITAGTGISVVNAAGSITVSATGSGVTWTDQTADFTAAVNNGYTMNKAGTPCVGTLPAVAPYGSVINIVGKGATGWQVAQPAGVTIHFGITNTTAGVTGSIASTQQYDTIELLCTIANTDWTVIDSIGNLTVV